MNTKEKIIHEAIQLFKDEGFDNVSIPMICQKSKITKGTFYYYFQNKGDIIYDHVEGFLENITEVMPDILKTISPRDQLWKLYSFSFENIIDLSPKLLYAYYQTDMKNGLKQLAVTDSTGLGYYSTSHKKLMLSLIEKGQSCHEIREDKSAEELMEAYNAIIIGVGLDWACHNGKYDEKKYLKKMFDIIF